MSVKSKEKDQLDSGGGNVDQIREILFGGHLRAFDERFELVESRLAKETDALRKATDKKIQALERLASEVREEASDHLGTEASNRDLALNKVELALGQSRADLENQLAMLEDRMADDLKQLRVEMKAMHKELSAALAKADRERGKEAEKLNNDKVARRDLADLLKGLAQNIYPEATKRSK